MSYTRRQVTSANPAASPRPATTNTYRRFRLPAEVAPAWKQRLRIKTTVATTKARDWLQTESPRLTARHTLAAMRALYLDLAQWALEDPARWAPWVAPCPVTKADLNSRKETRHRTGWMRAPETASHSSRS